MDRVVYLLGAGFSAPLGLPVMSNFLEMAKDIYELNPRKNKHFKKVFDAINTMAKAGMYYSADFFNIEEVLSILEMERMLASRQTEELFTRFISDVITHYSPILTTTFVPTDQEPNRWKNNIFEGFDYANYYGHFVCALLNVEISLIQDTSEIPYLFRIHCEPVEDRDRQYSIVTLNYDLVLEMTAKHLMNNFSGGSDIRFNRADLQDEEGSHIGKLHGSIDNPGIVPPTWNKNLHENIVEEWKMAYRLFSEANHIRVIGYSLPETDAYVRYLLKSAIAQTLNLKSFDVICLDNENDEIRSRYSAFLRFPKFRFVSGVVENYLRTHTDKLWRGTTGKRGPLAPRRFLEDAHEVFMTKSISLHKENPYLDPTLYFGPD